MALFRLPLWLNRKVSFWKLMGSGKNGTFDKQPDWQQWAILQVGNVPGNIDQDSNLMRQLYGSFIATYWKLFRCKTITYILDPIEGHGLWSGQKPFGELPRKTDYEGKIAVLTRATIRRKKLDRFWSHVEGVAQQMSSAAGFITSYGIGEMPYIRQATFSIWESKEAMRKFAYKLPEHAEVVKKTHAENWYSEDLFVRFKILHQQGNL
jgi:heme-degrading monooxygenase HmoA